MQELVAINGEVFFPEKAKVSVFDRGFLYGDSVYEVVRAYNRILFAVEPHVDRLFRSAARIGLDLKASQKEIIDMIYGVYKKSELKDAYVRIIVTRGEGPITLDPAASPGPTTVVMVKSVPKIDPKWYSEGIDLVVPQVFRNPKGALDPNIKSGNYLNSVMAFADAKKRQAHDAVMLNKEGFVTECTTSNIFMVENGIIVTPPDDADILHGITRQIIRGLCEENEIPLRDEFFNFARLASSDEIFITGSVKEIIPVRTLEGKKIGSQVPGPITRKLTELYQKYVEDYCRNTSPN